MGLLIGPHTVEDWLAMDNLPDGSHLELIFGHLHATPPPSGEHQTALLRVTRVLDDAIDAAQRADLHVVLTVNVRISTPWRTALMPDVVVLNREPVGLEFTAGDVALVVEVWAPSDSLRERETKLACYAFAGVPLVWTIDQGDDPHGPTLSAFRLQDGLYTVENKIQADGPATITAAPVPITLDLTRLLRKPATRPEAG